MPWKDLEARKIYSAKYYKENKERLRPFREKNNLKYRKTEKAKVAGKKYRQKHSKELKEYRQNYKPRANELERLACDKLENRYVKQHLRKLGFSKEVRENNTELIETYKVIIKTKRLCKKLTT